MYLGLEVGSSRKEGSSSVYAPGRRAGAPPLWQLARPPQDPSPPRGTLGSSLRSPAEGEGNEGFPPPPETGFIFVKQVFRLRLLDTGGPFLPAASHLQPQVHSASFPWV